MKKIDSLEIVKKLIAIPSWVNEKNNETKIANWVFDFLKKNSTLRTIKQPIGNGRFNILAQNNTQIDILVTGHIDTVKPVTGWTKNPIFPELLDDKLYGLGSSDMKSGVAIMLFLTVHPKLKDNIGFLFYCDEEYDFLGMKKFIEDYQNKIQPKLIVSLDGEGLQISNSCRGLIELKILVKGKAGHAANPKSGLNAITESFKVINKLENWLTSYNSIELGQSTLNIAYISGGGKDGNVIAEQCEYIVEIRVANEKLNAELVSEFISNESKKLGLKIDSLKIKHDFGSWITKEKDLKDYIALTGKKLKSSKKSGYIDIQMLWETFNHVPTFSFGVGEEDISHTANEYVKIVNILKTQKIFERFVLN